MHINTTYSYLIFQKYLSQYSMLLEQRKITNTLVRSFGNYRSESDLEDFSDYDEDDIIDPDGELIKNEDLDNAADDSYTFNRHERVEI